MALLTSDMSNTVCVCVCVYIQTRRRRLEDSVRQFALFRECDDVKGWIKEKVSQLLCTVQYIYMYLSHQETIRRHTMYMYIYCMLTVYNIRIYHMATRRLSFGHTCTRTCTCTYILTYMYIQCMHMYMYGIYKTKEMQQVCVQLHVHVRIQHSTNSTIQLSCVDHTKLYVHVCTCTVLSQFLYTVYCMLTVYNIFVPWPLGDYHKDILYVDSVQCICTMATRRLSQGYIVC